MRNLKADLEICQKATPGPWKRITKGNTVQSRAITTDTGECGIQKTICASISTKTTDDLFIAAAREGWPEAIERAIKAEETLESLLDDYTMILLNVPGAATADGIVDYIERIRIENAALREENDLQRANIQRLSAQVAELRDALESIKKHECPPIYTRDGHCLNAIKGCFECMAGYHLERISSNLGADLLAKIERLEAVAEAAREFDRQIMRDRYTSQGLKRLWEKDVRQALVDLEGGK